MAIEMVESSEFDDLSQGGTLGGFADDNNYTNFVPVLPSIAATAFGINRRKKRTQAQVQQRNVEWAIDPNMANDCDYLQQRYQELRNKIDFELKKNPNKLARKRYLDPLYGAEVNFKNAISQNKCEEKKAQAEEERLKKEAEDAIKRTAADTPKIPEVKVAQGSPVTKIIIIGVGVLVLAVVGVALFRKRN